MSPDTQHKVDVEFTNTNSNQSESLETYPSSTPEVNIETKHMDESHDQLNETSEITNVPTEEEVAIAAKILGYYAQSATSANTLKELQGKDARNIRKSLAQLNNIFSKSHFGGKSHEEYIQSKRVSLEENSRSARIRHLKTLDRDHINSVQLRSQRLEALEKLTEQQETANIASLIKNHANSMLTITDEGKVVTAIEMSESEPALLSTIPKKFQPNKDQPKKQKGPTPVNNKAAGFDANKRSRMHSDKDTTIPPELQTNTLDINIGKDKKNKKAKKNEDDDQSGSISIPTKPLDEAEVLLGRLETDKPDDFPKILSFTNSCYVCKRRYLLLHKFYHLLCPSCSRLNWYKRHQTANLQGYVALLTGSRVKIGFECGLKLLRCGALLIATSRFPHDTAKRYAEQDDYELWKDRLHIYGLDLRDLKAVISFTDLLKKKYGSVDIIVNNAAQTIRRPVMYYRHILDDELIPRQELPEKYRHIVHGDAHSPTLQQTIQQKPVEGDEEKEDKTINTQETEDTTNTTSAVVEEINDDGVVTQALEKHTRKICPTTTQSIDAIVMSSLGETMDDKKTLPPISTLATSASLSQLIVNSEDKDENGMSKYFPVGLVDITGQQLDLRPENSWILSLGQIEPGELVETFAINTLAPFILNSRLLPAMKGENLQFTAPDGYQHNHQKARFIINVSAMEGKFYRSKSHCHPHTNMAKAALNMMTRTSSQECVKHNIFMNSVDTGWINDENPYEIAQTIADKHNFQTPIDEIDAMARILDPILDAVNTGKAIWGRFLKDYAATEW